MPYSKDYERKTGFVKLTWQIRKIQDARRRNMNPAQAQLTLFSDKIGGLLDELGVYADLRHQYLAYALALDKAQRDMDFMVDVLREARILRHRFEERGLDPDVLQAIYDLIVYRSRDR